MVGRWPIRKGEISKGHLVRGLRNQRSGKRRTPPSDFSGQTPRTEKVKYATGCLKSFVPLLQLKNFWAKHWIEMVFCAGEIGFWLRFFVLKMLLSFLITNIKRILTIFMKIVVFRRIYPKIRRIFRNHQKKFGKNIGAIPQIPFYTVPAAIWLKSVKYLWSSEWCTKVKI
jgi:hypothetical protein